MSQVVRFEFDGGGSVLVEPAADAGVVRISGGGSTIRGATATYEAALEGVRHAAEATLRQFTGLARQPDEVTVEFGVRLDLAAGAVIARTAVEGHLQVSVMWKRPDPNAAADPQNSLGTIDPRDDDASDLVVADPGD
jgi:hypothetical protein